MLSRDKKRVVSPSGGDRDSEMLGDGGTDRYLGSGEEDGLASMDLGTTAEVNAGFIMSSLVSEAWELSRWAAMEAVTVHDPLRAVLGSRPDMVTVVTTPLPPEAEEGERPPRDEGSGWLSPGDSGKHFLLVKTRCTLRVWLRGIFRQRVCNPFISSVRNCIRWRAVMPGLKVFLLRRS